MNTNKNEKMTNRKALEYVLNECSLPDEVKEKCENMLAQLIKKNSAERKPTATQVANEALKQDIVSAMERDRLYTISEMIKEFPCCSDLSTPKVSAIIRLLMQDGVVVRTVDKRKAYFSLA